MITNQHDAEMPNEGREGEGGEREDDQYRLLA